VSASPKKGAVVHGEVLPVKCVMWGGGDIAIYVPSTALISQNGAIYKQAVLWIFTVFLKGEAHKTGNCI